MDPVITVSALTKSYKDTTAVREVSFEIERNTIYGFLGRNGAGKTTTMSILTAQNFATSGSVRVFGEDPYENPSVLRRICFVREGQKYPDDATPAHALAAARLFFDDWDEDFARSLVDDFAIPVKTRIKKLSRGQESAVGVVIGLASRAEITFFDEPYLGLDAVARQLFYDRLLEDYSRRPRTIILSSHLIDEVSDLLEHVLVIDEGRIVLDESTEEALRRATTLIGPIAHLGGFTAGHEILHEETLGPVAKVTMLGRLEDRQVAEAHELGVEIAPVSLQQLLVHLTRAREKAGDDLPRTDTRTAGVER